jgi:hypothetical protein
MTSHSLRRYTPEAVARRREISALLHTMKALARNSWYDGLISEGQGS